jgi:hypothetical protein
MRYRHSVILSAEAANTAGTKVVNLDTKDPISALYIHAKYTNNGSTPTAHPAAILSKIEVCDGSDVIYSLSGYEMEALSFYHNGRPNICVFSTIDNNIGTFFAQLNFGRWLFDPLLALDPSRFSNLQLKITHNLASGGSAPDALTLEVSADLFSEYKPDLLGFLMNKEIFAYTVVASATQYVPLPCDHPYRMIMIQSRANDHAPIDQYNTIRLESDSGKHLILDDNTSDLYKVIGSRFPRFMENYRYNVSTTATPHYITPAADTLLIPTTLLGTDSGHLNLTAYGGQIDLDGTAQAECDAFVSGMCPHGALPILFGDLANIDDLLSVDDIGSLRLRLVAGASALASSTCQIAIQQLRKYT